MRKVASKTTSLRGAILLTFLLLPFLKVASAFVPFETQTSFGILSLKTTRTTTSFVTARLAAASKDDDNNDQEDDKWDANVDYDKEWKGENTVSPSNPDPTTAWDDLPAMPEKPVLGIDISLDPISQQEAAEIRKQAKDVINQQFDKGIKDIERMRSKMNLDIEKSKRAMQYASELNAQSQSKDLMDKIDKMTNKFLDANQESRKTTKLAAAASQAMEGTGQGLEMGTWGTLSGRTVIASPSSSLLGSVDNAVAKAKQAGDSDSSASTADAAVAKMSNENRILILADTKQDPMAKQLVPALLDAFENRLKIDNLKVEVFAPTATMPLGGNDADCVVVLTTSFSQASSLSTSFDRLLRKTLQVDGTVGRPPTQLVGISTVGTERYEQFPYNMQNLMGGGKLEKRRQMEEVLVNQAKRRVTEPPLDYTILKLGELSNKAAGKEFMLKPGDVLDDPIDLDTAVSTILQAVAYQPFARNSTLCVSGSIADELKIADDESTQLFWDESFLCLDGPEVWRDENVGDVAMYDQLVEYLQGWGTMLAESGKGLTTPITTEYLGVSSSRLVSKQEGIELLFLPTKTGRNYVSKTDEKALEAETGRSTPNAASKPIKVFNRKTTKEGGIDVVVEVTREDPPQLRVRARRCNYGDDAVIKELSEETILKRLNNAMEVWEREHL